MIEIVAAGADRFKDVLAIWNQAWPEFASDEDELRHRDGLDETMRSRYWLVYGTGAPIGLLEIGPIAGSHHPQRWTINVAVSAGSRGRGVGAALYDFARCDIDSSDPISVITYVREADEASMRFAEARGFREDKRDFISVLDVKNPDTDFLDRLCSTDLPNRVRIAKGSEVDSPAFRHKLHALFEEVRKDIPRSFPPTPLTFEQFEDAFLDPQFLWSCSIFAMAGDEPVGFSTGFAGPTEGRVLQGLTAVSREYRGHGLAKCLKAHFVKAVIAAGYDSIATDNDTRNAAMLAVNDRFGFQRQPGCIHYLWSANGS